MRCYTSKERSLSHSLFQTTRHTHAIDCVYLAYQPLPAWRIPCPSSRSFTRHWRDLRAVHWLAVSKINKCHCMR
jgi:hypothetical protein